MILGRPGAIIVGVHPVTDEGAAGWSDRDINQDSDSGQMLILNHQMDNDDSSVETV